MFRFDHNIIHIHLHIFTHLRLQTFLHASLVSGTSISQTEAHDTIAISPIRGNKGSLYLIFLVQRDLVETRVSINEGQQLTPRSGIDHLSEVKEMDP